MTQIGWELTEIKGIEVVEILRFEVVRLGKIYFVWSSWDFEIWIFNFEHNQLRIDWDKSILSSWDFEIWSCGIKVEIWCGIIYFVRVGPEM